MGKTASTGSNEYKVYSVSTWRALDWSDIQLQEVAVDILAAQWKRSQGSTVLLLAHGVCPVPISSLQCVHEV